MWEIHLRIRLLKILENYRLKHGKCLTREEWVGQALCNGWVWLHHPILGTFKRTSFKRKIEKVINPCIPPSERFNSMSSEEKEKYYTTYNYAEDEKGQPILALLEITQKGIRLTGLGGYTQRLYELYKGPWIAIAWLTSLILSYLFGKTN